MVYLPTIDPCIGSLDVHFLLIVYEAVFRSGDPHVIPAPTMHSPHLNTLFETSKAAFIQKSPVPSGFLFFTTLFKSLAAHQIQAVP